MFSFCAQYPCFSLLNTSVCFSFFDRYTFSITEVRTSGVCYAIYECHEPADVVDVVGRRREDVFGLFEQRIRHFDALVKRLRLALRRLLTFGGMDWREKNNKYLSSNTLSSVQHNNPQDLNLQDYLKKLVNFLGDLKSTQVDDHLPLILLIKPNGWLRCKKIENIKNVCNAQTSIAGCSRIAAYLDQALRCCHLILTVYVEHPKEFTKGANKNSFLIPSYVVFNGPQCVIVRMS